MVGPRRELPSRARTGRTNDPDQQGKPVPHTRQSEVAGDIVEGIGVAGSDEALPRHDHEDNNRKRICNAFERRHPTGREIIDRVDGDVLVAQEGAWERKEKCTGEQKLNEIVNASNR
jgi:hypothetical protein